MLKFTNCKALFHRVWLHVLSGLAIGTAVFLIMYELQPPSWEASGFIRTGRVPKKVEGLKAELVFIMPPDQTQQLWLSTAQEVVDTTASTDQQPTFRVRQMADGMFELKVKAISEGYALKTHESILEKFKLLHNEIFREHLKFWAEEESRIADETYVMHKFLDNRIAACKKASSFELQLVCMNLTEALALRLDKLMDYYANMQELRISTWTYPTGLVGSISVLPVWPNLKFSVLMAILSAVVAMIIVEMLKRGLFRLRKINAIHPM